MAKSTHEQVEEAVSYIRSQSTAMPSIGLVLGTGLGRLSSKIDNRQEIKYSQIPGFPISTAPGHSGKLLLGEIAHKRVVAMQGRPHLYEGYSPQEIALPIRVMRMLGVDRLIESNASGGMNRYYKAGDVMIIDDHINFTGANPLIGPNDETLGPRFPDMSAPYDEEMMELLEQIAAEQQVRCHRGVYIGVSGPNFETRAEYRFFQAIGADAVGMSTVVEVIAARHCGLRVLGLSCITDMCIPDTLTPVDSDKVIAVAERAEPRITQLVLEFICRLKV